MDRPFMEHPSGDFESAIDAMSNAINRLRELPDWGAWITFHVQGAGSRPDSYHFAAIRMRQDDIELERPIELDTELVTKRAGATDACLVKTASCSIGEATPCEAACMLDFIFRHYLGIRPHPDEGDDYAIGAEW
jgi:hypothetical protein